MAPKLEVCHLHGVPALKLPRAQVANSRGSVVRLSVELALRGEKLPVSPSSSGEYLAAKQRQALVLRRNSLVLTNPFRLLRVTTIAKVFLSSQICLKGSSAVRFNRLGGSSVRLRTLFSARRRAKKGNSVGPELIQCRPEVGGSA